MSNGPVMANSRRRDPALARAIVSDDGREIWLKTYEGDALSLTISRERIDDANAGLRAALAKVQGAAGGSEKLH